MGIERLTRLLSIVRKPVESVTWIMAFCLLVFALYLASPWYVPNYPDIITARTESDRIVEYAVSLIFFCGSLPGVVFPLLGDGPRRKALKFATFFLFAAFLFQTVLRGLSEGWIPPNWIAPATLTLISGALRLYLEVKKE